MLVDEGRLIDLETSPLAPSSKALQSGCYLLYRSRSGVKLRFGAFEWRRSPPDLVREGQAS